MKDNMEKLLQATYHQGEKPADNLNQTILEMAKEREDMRKKGMKADERKNAERRRGMRGVTAAAAAAVVLLLGTGGYAATRYFGLDFFAEKYGENTMTEEAKELVERKPEVTIKEQEGSQNLLDYQVSELLCDSRYVLATIDISAKEEGKYLLVSGPTDIDEPVSMLSLGIDSEQSIGEYCREHGMQPLLLHLNFDKKTEKYLSLSMYDNAQKEAGRLTMMICAERLTDDKEFMMNVKPDVVIYEGEEYQSYYEDDILQVHVINQSEEESALYAVDGAGEYKVPGTSMTLQGIELKSTEIGSYLKVQYRFVPDSDDAEEELIELCDENGKAMPVSMIAIHSAKPTGENTYESEGCYENVGLPDTIYLKIGADSDKVVKAEKKK